MTFSCNECGRIILSCFNKVPLFKTVIAIIICFYEVRYGLSFGGYKVFHIELYLFWSFKVGSLLVSAAISLIPIASRIGVTCKE